MYFMYHTLCMDFASIPIYKVGKTLKTRIISSTNFNAQFNNNMYLRLLSSTCFGPWHAHPQEEQLHKHSIWYPRCHKRLYTTLVESSLLSTGVVYSRLWERGYQMLCLCSCSSWGWACQGPKHVEDSIVTYMLLLNCALKLVEEIIISRGCVNLHVCMCRSMSAFSRSVYCSSFPLNKALSLDLLF